MTDIDTRAQLTERRLELLRRRLDERGLTATTAPVDDVSAMSEGQLRMWFVHAADPSRALLNVCLSYRITGAVDTDRLHEAVDAVAVRHPVLRTTYRTASADNGSTGMPVPTVHPDLRPGWAEHDLSELSERARRLRLEVLAQREFSAPFDLNAESPLRITVIRISATELVLLLVAHHIAWDDGSWEVFFADLTRAYQGEPLAPSRAWVSPQVNDDADVAYWRAVMADPPEPLELPGPTGSAVPTSWRSRRTDRKSVV